MLRGTVYTITEEDVPFAGVDFISFVAFNTYGKPAIIAPGTEGHDQSAGKEVTVLYVNPQNIVALEVTKRP